MLDQVDFFDHRRKPENNAELEAALKQAVSDGRLIPEIHHHDRGGVPPTTPPASTPRARAVDGILTTASSSSGGDGNGLGLAEVVAGVAAVGALGYVASAEPATEAVDGSGTPGASTPLGNAQPFEYQPDMPDGGSFDIAKTPNEGDPGTWYTNPGSGQMRLYGDDRKAVVDFDFDHDHGQGIPHAHNGDDGARGPGLPFFLLP
ncbi:hypothetical protein EVC45_41235 [Paraburkholderia sp. UYCP14C]|uniref:hypothetical protein n=1 Tax=Paraburkholderia sp. UYCP14C TaxID=2511130 RepID=UPI00101F2049|nr:hypothetical protein [Paraburkholderia sp. UYCP14C]RZF23983.1 hypothetical protein EVC45_41235 [Paraburkholderia sp. UYCP14C]